MYDKNRRYFPTRVKAEGIFVDFIGRAASKETGCPISMNLKNGGGMIMKNQCHAPTGAVYGLGLIGAAIYYISSATTFWIGVLGFLKAIVWPAFLVYEMLKYLAM